MTGHRISTNNALKHTAGKDMAEIKLSDSQVLLMGEK